MCPFSGITQIFLIILTIILFHTVIVNTLQIKFHNETVKVHMGDTISVPYTILRDQNDTDEKYWLQLQSLDNNLANVQEKIYLTNDELPLEGIFNLTGIFLGKTTVTCKYVEKNTLISGNLDVIIVREERLIDKIFTVSVIALVSIIYINFGCVLNWGELRQNLKRPIGPVIGLCGQFILMPLLSYALGKIIFPDSPEMQLGMFFTGVSPAGGASNIWTLVLDGNVDLSITMTTISTIAAFGMMPLWIFTLGKFIFDDAKLAVPYRLIAHYALALVIPLAIGYLLTRYCKKVASFLARILKGFSSLLILFIIVFATVTNLYLFKLFSWKIVLAGMGLPYIGFILAYIFSKVLRQPSADTLAISIETGIQNTGIAIFLLRVSLSQPAADLTTVCPVAVSVMTPLPLMAIYIYKKIQARLRSPRKEINGNVATVDCTETEKCFTILSEERTN
ncbi:hypothetical protein HHI36_008294 [Cryptolaemus montrouzieri]|uniref:Ileal sodium/bile acid cotransporter n=1 Tax=Cryptolaemus montrouzieri TaxID=559131 RepID=A0ABD2MSK7_9CUCU